MKNYLQFALIAIALSGVAGCSRLEGPSQRLTTSAPTAATSKQLTSTDLRDFVGSEVAVKLSQREQTEAASAQFYALQYGRPGAPRTWQGDSGASGRVSVGPFVQVNSLFCRDFSHYVTVAGKSYQNNGTACREPDGSWKVEES